MRRYFYVAITLSFTLFFITAVHVHAMPHETEYFTTWGTDYSVSPASGTNYHLTRKIDQYGALVGGTYNPTKPPDRAFYTASIIASGLGKIAFTFSEGSSHTKKVGDWGNSALTLGLTTWYETEENKEVEWSQPIVFPCWRIEAGHHPGDITAPVDTSRIYTGTPHVKNVTSTMVPKPAVLVGISSTYQITIGKSPSAALRLGSGWRMDSRSPIPRQINAQWNVTYSDTNVISCKHNACTEIVQTAEQHYVPCNVNGTPKGCGDSYGTCQPDASRHKSWPCVICGIDFKPCTPEGHEEWVSGSCPASLTINGSTIDCDADPNGYFKCIHLHNYPNGSGSQSGDGGGVGMGQGTSNYLALGGQNGGGTPPSNGGCNTPPANGGCTTPPANGGCTTPPANGGCTTIATACINPICIRNTACATYTCIRSIIIGRRADGTAITEPCGELFTQCQNLLMQRGICSGERLTTLRDYHSDLYR